MLHYGPQRSETMTIRLRHVVALLLLGAIAAAPPPGPETLVSQIYAGYLSANDAYSPLATDASIKRTFSTALAALLFANTRLQVKTQSVGCLESDPFIVGQDYQITALQVSSVVDPATPSRATVTAAFHNFDAPRVVSYTMLREPSGWRIDDLQSGPDSSFKAKLQRCLKVG